MESSSSEEEAQRSVRSLETRGEDAAAAAVHAGEAGAASGEEVSTVSLRRAIMFLSLSVTGPMKISSSSLSSSQMAIEAVLFAEADLRAEDPGVDCAGEFVDVLVDGEGVRSEAGEEPRSRASVGVIAWRCVYLPESRALRRRLPAVLLLVPPEPVPRLPRGVMLRISEHGDRTAPLLLPPLPPLPVLLLVVGVKLLARCAASLWTPLSVVAERPPTLMFSMSAADICWGTLCVAIYLSV